MKLAKKKFIIEGMHCVSCAMNIDFDLEDLEGIKGVSTNYAKAECIVEYEEDKVDEKKIVETIKTTGYSAIIAD